MKLNEITLSFWNECHISKNGMGLTDVGQMPFDMITGNHVIHVRKNKYDNNDI